MPQRFPRSPQSQGCHGIESWEGQKPLLPHCEHQAGRTAHLPEATQGRAWGTQISDLPVPLRILAQAWRCRWGGLQVRGEMPAGRVSKQRERNVLWVPFRGCGGQTRHVFLRPAGQPGLRSSPL